MKKVYKKQPNERLCDWCRRLSEDFMWHRSEPESILEMLEEVSKTSYIVGSNDAVHVSHGFSRIY